MAEPLRHNDGWQRICAALAQLRSECDGWEELWRQQLEELDALQLLMVEREKAVAEERLAQADLLAATSARADALERQNDSLQQEMASLEEAMLEAQQAAESEKRRSADQRSKWESDLLQGAMAMQSQMLKETKGTDAKSRREAAQQAPRLDPVLNAVMTQFEMLQHGRGNGKTTRQEVAKA